MIGSKFRWHRSSIDGERVAADVPYTWVGFGVHRYGDVRGGAIVTVKGEIRPGAKRDRKVGRRHVIQNFGSVHIVGIAFGVCHKRGGNSAYVHLIRYKTYLGIRWTLSRRAKEEDVETY